MVWLVSVFSCRDVLPVFRIRCSSLCVIDLPELTTSDIAVVAALACQCYHDYNVLFPVVLQRSEPLGVVILERCTVELDLKDDVSNSFLLGETEITFRH